MTAPAAAQMTYCANCERELWEGDAEWQETVNLTPDALFVSHEAVHQFDNAIIELDVAFDWCSLDCFGRWLYRATVAIGTRARL